MVPKGGLSFCVSLVTKNIELRLAAMKSPFVFRWRFGNRRSLRSRGAPRNVVFLEQQDLEIKHAPSAQAYSGRDGAMRRPGPTARSASSYSRTAQRAVPTRFPASTWLNLVCLDAPLVSVVWLWLFARTLDVAVRPLAGVALLLTGWLIYLADRLADSLSLPRIAPRSLRHQFCLQHQRFWIVLLVAICVTDLVILRMAVPFAVLAPGLVVGSLAALHLLLNYSLGGAWPPFPLKEVVTGTLFAAGTLVPLAQVLRPITPGLILSAAAFAVLCTLNCISIAFWERELDQAQGKVSFATRFPRLRPYWGRFLMTFALVVAVLPIFHADFRPILVCASASAFFLTALDFNHANLRRDERTALADLVLLTPLLAFGVMMR